MTLLNQRIISVLGGLLIGQISQVAFGQGSNFNQMESLLNQVDQPSSWTAQQALPAQPTYGSGIGMQGLPAGQGIPQESPLFSRQNIMRALLGGSQSQSTASSDFGRVRSNVEDDLQRARNERDKAESDCERASHGLDRELRMSAAEDARYAAEAAQQAAERAESAAQNTTNDISGLAASARAAANQAQAAADRATSNAEGGGGW